MLHLEDKSVIRIIVSLCYSWAFWATLLFDQLLLASQLPPRQNGTSDVEIRNQRCCISFLQVSCWHQVNATFCQYFWLCYTTFTKHKRLPHHLISSCYLQRLKVGVRVTIELTLCSFVVVLWWFQMKLW